MVGRKTKATFITIKLLGRLVGRKTKATFMTIILLVRLVGRETKATFMTIKLLGRGTSVKQSMIGYELKYEDFLMNLRILCIFSSTK